MEYYKLCDSDYRFMMVVWEHAPVGSGDWCSCAAKLWDGKSQPLTLQSGSSVKRGTYRMWMLWSLS